MKNVNVLLLMFALFFAGQKLTAQITTSLDEKEASMIQVMLEEEKLAKDVYSVFAEKWEGSVFSHISSSEKRHFDKVKELANRYAVAIPMSVKKDELGIFQNKELQKDFKEMIQIGSDSLKNALRVGAIIEETDIQNLTASIAKTKNENMLKIFLQLKKASEKHLQSFYKNLVKEGANYSPQILSQKDFDNIIKAKESCQGGKCQTSGCCSNKKTKSGKAEKSCGDKKAKNKKGKACCSSS